MNVTKHTRAGKNGKRLVCPHCAEQWVAYHFAWFGLVCGKCRKIVTKTDWLLAPVEALDGDDARDMRAIRAAEAATERHIAKQENGGQS